MLPQQNSITFVTPLDIVYCQSDNCYTNIFLGDGKRIMIVKSLSKFEKELPGNFFLRVNQSFLVNKSFVSTINKKERMIALTQGALIPFTIRLKELLLLMTQSA